MNATQIAMRAEVLLRTGQSSAVVCAQDALVCSANAQTGEPHPQAAHYGCKESAAQLWMRAASRWIERGASHAFGYNLPEGW